MLILNLIYYQYKIILKRTRTYIHTNTLKCEGLRPIHCQSRFGALHKRIEVRKSPPPYSLPLLLLPYNSHSLTSPSSLFHVLTLGINNKNGNTNNDKTSYDCLCTRIRERCVSVRIREVCVCVCVCV